jgi:uncharacterized protein (TIGR02246 family)
MTGRREDGSEGEEAMDTHPGVERLLADWHDAIDAGDVDRLADLVTPDAEFWSSGQPPIRGREEVRAAFVPVLGSFRMSQDFVRDELIVAEPWAFMRGLEVNRLTEIATGEETVIRQRGFSLMRRGEDGVWRFHRGMTNQPPPG